MFYVICTLSVVKVERAQRRLKFSKIEGALNPLHGFFSKRLKKVLTSFVFNLKW